jgi:Sigma-70, region 4
MYLVCAEFETHSAAHQRALNRRRCVRKPIAHRNARWTCGLAAMSAPQGVRMTGPHSFLTRPGYPDGILGWVAAQLRDLPRSGTAGSAQRCGRRRSRPVSSGPLMTVQARVAERRRAAALARHYRDEEGLSIQEIARRLGRAPATVKAYL